MMKFDERIAEDLEEFLEKSRKSEKGIDKVEEK